MLYTDLHDYNKVMIENFSSYLCFIYKLYSKPALLSGMLNMKFAYESKELKK